MLEKVNKIAENLKITNLLNKNLGEISGGEKQKVLMAAALIQDTPVIILDEPTSALDLKNQNMVLSLLKEIRKTGITILLSVHNPNHALFLDPNVILIKQGKVLKSGCAKSIVWKSLRTINEKTNMVGIKITSSQKNMAGLMWKTTLCFVI